MTDPNLDDFPFSAKGHQFEDFTVGQVLEHHWGRTLTECDNMIFSTATCNWNPMYLNAEFARAHGHADIVVNPMVALCIAVGLSAEDLSVAGGPFLGLNDCVFHVAMFPGDTITARSEVVETRTSASRPGFGVVTWHTEVHNQHGELVLDFRRTNLAAMRMFPLPLGGEARG
jgi:acyl dehydratase